MIPLEGIDLFQFNDSLRINRNSSGLPQVYDVLRKKYIRTSPEEIVRQLWIHYLLDHIGLSRKLIAVERAFKSHDFTRRFDLVVFDKSAHPILLAEFKSPNIPVRQSSFDQIARYNMQLNVPYSLISNGHVHYCFEIDHERRGYVWKDELPF